MHGLAAQQILNADIPKIGLPGAGTEEVINPWNRLDRQREASGLIAQGADDSAGRTGYGQHHLVDAVFLNQAWQQLRGPHHGNALDEQALLVEGIVHKTDHLAAQFRVAAEFLGHQESGPTCTNDEGAPSGGPFQSGRAVHELVVPRPGRPPKGRPAQRGQQAGGHHHVMLKRNRQARRRIG
ncbi:hypothetical protein GALL_523770 [mine drainage metagenome]|uniref:Uncharacterized protein n=1 Tax=mine drainage metagenome TaxID=410659 RepID=A0A1J5PL95_9ZZZZ